MNIRSFVLDKTWLYEAPLFALLFIYFGTSSFDLLQMQLGPFSFKFTQAFAVVVFCVYSVYIRTYFFMKKYLSIFGYLFAVHCFSILYSQNPISSAGFTLFFAFNFIFYFLLTINIATVFGFKRIFYIYRMSFICVGAYAMLQVISSMCGVYLPVAGQRMGSIVRGQVFCYEPSYYALYFTPFIMFENARTLMHSSEGISRGWLILYNLFFLMSTSTGCLFAYLFFVVAFMLFNPTFWKAAFQFLSWVALLFSSFALLFQSGFEMLLKFFYQGLKQGSIVERWSGIERDWAIFMEFPLTGVGAGAISTYARKKIMGDVVWWDGDILHSFTPTNVTIEVLASFGLIGAVGFGFLLWRIARDLWDAMCISNLTYEEQVMLRSLGISLLVLFFVLQFNQSIMRVYVWIYVAMLLAYTQELRKRTA